VTFKMTALIIEGWHTYTSVKEDPDAPFAPTTIAFPEQPNLIAVGKLQDPPFKIIHDLPEVKGEAVWTRPFVVSPKATPGKVEIEISVTMAVCDANHCIPPATTKLTLPLTILPEEVPVDAKYKDDVEKALSGGTTKPPLPIVKTNPEHMPAVDQA